MDENTLDLIAEKRLVPVVVLENAADVLPLGEALIKGGLPVAEITFRTAAAEKSIRKMIAEFPTMLVGAGTVVNVEQAKRAIDAGAKFVVSPGTNEKVVEYVLEQNVAMFPGACTPSEIMTVMDYGLPVAKFFPAKQLGGLDTIKALAAPFPSMRFMPTGGINAGNILDFLSFDKVIACGGSWMVQASLVREGRFDEIERLTREAVELVAGA